MLQVNCNCDDSERTIKTIYVFSNGEKYTGQRVVLNQNRWHHILSKITTKLDPYFGKVEKLYTTSSGLTVYSFTDLQNNATYVASDRARRFTNVKGGYTIDTEPTQEYFEHYLSSQLQRINKNKKLVYVRRDLLVIYIFRNGECGHLFKIVLTSDDLSSWSHILSYIALILDVPERCIKSLYSVNGNKICGPWELQHGASYVAVGYNQTFRKGCYHVNQKSTEVLTTGYPVVPKDKNLICAHKVRRKMKPPFKWNHYDQFTCNNVQTKKGSMKSRNGSKKSRRSSSQAYASNSENKSEEYTNGDNKNVQNKSLENKSVENKSIENKSGENDTLKKNKKVTVHMRIKNSVASNVMVTRNSGDSSPPDKKKKKWEDDDDSSNSDKSNSDNSNTNSTFCDCTTKTCSTSERNKHRDKYQSEPSSSDSSDIPTNSRHKRKNSKEKHTGRNLTWKHVKRGPQSSSKGEKVSVHVRGGQAVILSGSSENSLAVKKSAKSVKKKKVQKKQKKNPNAGNCEAKKSILKNNSKSKKNCSSSCGEDECKFYKIAKPTMDKYRASHCPNASSNSKPSKSKHNTVLKKARDNSDSRLKNRNYLISCKEAAKCKEPKRKNILKRISDFFIDSCTSIDSTKGKQQTCEYYYDDDTDTEDSSNLEYESFARSKPHSNSKPRSNSRRPSNSHNQSSCTICRFQEERRNLVKRYK